MNLKIGRIGKAAAALLIFWVGAFAVSADEAFSEAEQQKARELVKQLETGDFAGRAAAAAGLEALPLSAVPWLKEKIEAAGTTDVEVTIRLKAIVHAIEKREAERGVLEGTEVKIELEAAKPADILKALNQKVGSRLNGLSIAGYWETGLEAKDFSYEGSYWGAIDAMLKLFPPNKGGRENLGGEYDMARWGKADFGASANVHSNVGILRLRNGRMSLEHSGGKDYLVVTLVPSVEPTFQAEGLTLLVEALVLESGVRLEPEKRVCEWKTEGRGVRFSPSGTFTWIFPLEKGTELRGSVKMEGVANIRARRFGWREVALPGKLDGPVDMSPTVKLSVHEGDPGNLKIQFEGQGSRPTWAAHYEYRSEGYKVLDKDGKELSYSVRRSSSSGSNGWKTSYEGAIKGEPARLRARLRDEEQEVEVEFELVDLPMPGSSLID